jgi:hypothetical protein
VWTIDLQFRQTMDVLTLKVLKVVDDYSRVCLAIRVGRGSKAVEVINTIEEFLKHFQHRLLCAWTMSLSSLPVLCKRGAQAVVRERHPYRARCQLRRRLASIT